MYHRFPRRDDLIAAAWLRAQDRFLRGFLDTLATDGGPAAAVHVLVWSGEHPEDAHLLLRFGLRDVLREEISPALVEHVRTTQDALSAALRTCAAAADRDLADVTLALVDLPYATTRRILRAGRTPTDAEIAALRRAAELLLSDGAAGRG